MRVRKGSKQGEEEKREMMEAGYLIIAKVGKLRMASSFRFRWRMRAFFSRLKSLSSDGRKGPDCACRISPGHCKHRNIFLAHQQAPSPGTSASPNKNKTGTPFGGSGWGLSSLQGCWGWEPGRVGKLNEITGVDSISVS